MTLQELYNKLHGNYSDAKSRLLSDSLIDRFVCKFTADPSMKDLENAINKGDIIESFRASHTLKGVCANLGFTELYEASSVLCEQLRDNVNQADVKLFSDVQKKYNIVVTALEAYMADKQEER